MKPIILTGDRPTGKLHLGHFLGSLQNRLKLQDEYQEFIMIADMQALTSNADNVTKVRDSILEVALDYLAVGLDPKKITFFIQSMVPQLAELNMYFSNLVTLAQLQRNPTIKTEMKEKGYGADVPVGFLTHPISQAADILAFKPDLVPVGIDQLPLVEQTNEIAKKFNNLYQPIFKEVKALVPKDALARRLPGLDGNAKMSKSLGNAIYLADSSEDLKKKVMSMFTDPTHLKVSDPGKVKGNMVFTYLDVFDTNKAEVADLKKQYQKGGLGDVVLKQRLFKVLDEILSPIRERRLELAKNPEAIMEILFRGSSKASNIAQKTLEEAKKAMGINYKQ